MKPIEHPSTQNHDWRARCAWLAISTAMLATACGTGKSEAAPDEEPVAPGYVRFRMQKITVQPGEAVQNLEWVAQPFDHEMIMSDVIAHQGPGGHHGLLFTTAEVQRIGTVRTSVKEDMLRLQILGGAFGSGTAAVKPPKGTVMKVPAGRYLVIQSHWINATKEPITTHGYIDAKFEAEPPPGTQFASAFGFPLNDLVVQPMGDTALIRACPVPRDLPLLLFSNHMHEHGVRAKTTLVEPDGKETVLKEDPVWNPEWALAPNFEYHPVEAPLVIHAGSKVKVSCFYHNESNRTLAYPDEMCVFFGYYLGGEDVSNLPCDPTPLSE